MTAASRMRRRIRRVDELPLRLSAGVVGIALLAVAVLVPSAQDTEAGWVDAEVGGAEFTADTVPTPIASRAPGCVASGGLLGLSPSVTIYWRIPPDGDGYTSEDAEFGQLITGGVLEPLLGGLLGNTTTSGTPEGYTTVVNSGLLTGLLGGSKSFGIRLTGRGDWVSEWLVADASMGLAGVDPRCTVRTVPR
ncbi:hypothetical protein [Microbacterium sp. JB110]|uniref:hypothetical protein n=1 Tax=Microbacterium sp. JB110 TaxID=2024477 RepID=UPI00097ECDEC|nr:hypothetical protein [Microbacterium sp. JB110]RCS61317.1 hypothetical protein CIK77_07325 [Microbacterium sp. JB110]SJM50859.1 hypothetical protein CZ774_04835 [Frigoribacterium sp. JB110]